MEKKELTEVDTILKNTMERVKSLVDVSSIVGKPIILTDGNSVIPIAKISVGLLTGSGEMVENKLFKGKSYPLAGGVGTGYSINPIGFLMTQTNGEIKYISVNEKDSYKFLMDTFINLVKNISTNKEKSDE